MDHNFVVIRDVRGTDAEGKPFTLGRLLLDGSLFGYTGEDLDRELELHPENKVMHESAIPRGKYGLQATLSSRFGKVMPLLINVPGFSGVRIHAGNKAADTSGCILLGANRSINSVYNCRDVNDKLTAFIIRARTVGKACWIEIK